MRLTKLVALAILCSTTTIVYGQYNQYQQPYYQDQRSTLSYKCAQASEYIRNNNCGPQGCDIGLCVALQNGCRINSWGHVCPYPYPYTPPYNGR